MRPNSAVALQRYSKLTRINNGSQARNIAGNTALQTQAEKPKSYEEIIRTLAQPDGLAAFLKAGLPEPQAPREIAEAPEMAAKREERMRRAEPLAQAYARVLGHDPNTEEGAQAVESTIRFYGRSEQMLKRLEELVRRLEE